ncbi:hypothetical protein HPP92_014375 [Vanilla planifolia]|uniref:Uncharacterized protein n=1 Tax=Vanilla planifolia TaxID=51239 RepID=A0A835QRF3_VANPL|nr:hypothetical protein HPP92_014375 [Vanilla planifolia]
MPEKKKHLVAQCMVLWLLITGNVTFRVMNRVFGVKAVNKKVTKSRGKNGAGSRDASKKLSQEADVWNEDISSESQDEDDEDWTA